MNAKRGRASTVPLMTDAPDPSQNRKYAPDYDQWFC
jgi:hypothetical protein